MRTLFAPPRIIPGHPIWPLGIVAGLAATVWMIVVPMAYGVVQAAIGGQAIDTNHPLTGEALLFLSLAGPLAGLFIAIAGDLLAWSVSRQNLGVGFKRVPRGLLFGAIACAVVLPLMLGVLILTEWVYQRVGYKHPSEHELLRLMEEGTTATRYVAIVAAVVIAPVWEELFFRAHIQTLLRAAFASRAGRTGFPVVSVQLPGVAPSQYAPVPVLPILPPRLWEIVAAVGITAAAFTLVHPAWSWPPIFVLAICLGLVYELTGNLWASIAIHALFNASSTLIFLLSNPK